MFHLNPETKQLILRKAWEKRSPSRSAPTLTRAWHDWIQGHSEVMCTETLCQLCNVFISIEIKSSVARIHVIIKRNNLWKPDKLSGIQHDYSRTYIHVRSRSTMKQSFAKRRIDVMTTRQVFAWVHTFHVHLQLQRRTKTHLGTQHAHVRM